MSLKYLEIESSTNGYRNIIFILHGYGANADDLLSIATYWKRFLPNTLLCLPNAPNVCQVSQTGFEWFDLMQTDNNKILNEKLESLKKLEDTIEQKLKHLNLQHKNLILVGFSQGTMMSIQYAVRQKNKIAGVLGYSGKIFDYKFLEKEMISKPKMKFLHGNMDEIVPVEQMYESLDFLKNKKFNVDCCVYENLGHTISPDGLSDGLKFIKSISS